MSMWSGTSSHEFSVSRSGSAARLQFVISNAGVDVWGYALNYILNQNNWATVMITYSVSTSKILFTINGFGVEVDVSPIWRDKTLTGINMGVHPVSTLFNFNGDIAGAFVVDEYLSQTATTEITNTIEQGVDLTDTACLTGNACTACAAGTYKTSSGRASCTACPENSGADCIGCTTLTSCTCNAGYSGLN